MVFRPFASNWCVLYCLYILSMQYEVRTANRQANFKQAVILCDLSPSESVRFNRKRNFIRECYQHQFSTWTRPVNIPYFMMSLNPKACPTPLTPLIANAATKGKQRHKYSRLTSLQQKQASLTHVTCYMSATPSNSSLAAISRCHLALVDGGHFAFDGSHERVTICVHPARTNRR